MTLPLKVPGNSKVRPLCVSLEMNFLVSYPASDSKKSILEDFTDQTVYQKVQGVSEKTQPLNSLFTTTKGWFCIRFKFNPTTKGLKSTWVYLNYYGFLRAWRSVEKRDFGTVEREEFKGNLFIPSPSCRKPCRFREIGLLFEKVKSKQLVFGADWAC